MSLSRFFAGALVGVVAGLLLAPEKGEDLRNDIAESADKWKKTLQRIAGKTSAELDDLRSILGEEIDGLSDDVRYRILTMLDEAESSGAKIKKSVSAEL